jgi:hypothetical protein
MRRNSRASLRCSVVYKAEEQFILEFEVKLTMNYSKKKKEKKIQASTCQPYVFNLLPMGTGAMYLAVMRNAGYQIWGTRNIAYM